MSNKKELVLLNSIAIAGFMICWMWLGFELSDRTMFFGADSQDYLEVANWLYHGEDTVFTSTRPVLFPALIGFMSFFGGVIGIWILHFGCWLLTVNLTFLTVKKWTEKKTVAWIAALIVIANLSFIALTFQGLTEVVTTALLSLLCYHVISNRGQFNHLRFGQKLLLILVLLTLIKPSFYYPTLVCLIFILFAYRKQYRAAPLKILYPILIIVPILLQMTLVQMRHGSFTVSKIGGLTFTNYYFSQCVRNIEAIEDNQESIAFSEALTSDEKQAYILEHKGVFMVQFIENIVLNIKADPSFLDTKWSKQPESGFVFMRAYNGLSLIAHLLGSALFGLFFLISFFKRNKQMWIPLFCIGGLSSYYLFTTGLSFWQGDRLVLPTMALWIPLYAALFTSVATKLLMRLKRK